jgi:hypothetical protein
MTIAFDPSAPEMAATGSAGLPSPVEDRIALLERWLEASLDAGPLAWFRDTLNAVRSGDRGGLARAVGLAARRLGKADLVLGVDAAAAAHRVRPGFDPTGLSVDQAARIAFVLAAYRSDDAFAAQLEDLCRTADLQELVAYYRGFAVFPAGALLRSRAGEGIRSAMRPVFEAVAHRNPYPREYFEEPAWNQMVLKALFIGSNLAPIQGLDERSNSDLAATLVDYAHERWAAGRAVSPELWRCVGTHADGRALAALERVLTSGTHRERKAASLALLSCPEADAAVLLRRHGTGIEPADWDTVLAGAE